MVKDSFLAEAIYSSCICLNLHSQQLMLLSVMESIVQSIQNINLDMYPGRNSRDGKIFVSNQKIIHQIKKS